LSKVRVDPRRLKRLLHLHPVLLLRVASGCLLQHLLLVHQVELSIKSNANRQLLPRLRLVEQQEVWLVCRNNNLKLQ
jgi:hypothetical protein